MSFGNFQNETILTPDMYTRTILKLYKYAFFTGLLFSCSLPEDFFLRRFCSVHFVPAGCLHASLLLRSSEKECDDSENKLEFAVRTILFPVSLSKESSHLFLLLRQSFFFLRMRRAGGANSEVSSDASEGREGQE